MCTCVWLQQQPSLVTALTVPAVESCPSFTSSVEEGRAVCPGEELTYTCTIFDNTSIFPVAFWSGFCADSSDIVIAHGSAQESGMCGPFTVQATASDGDCYTSTLTVTASPELNGTAIQYSHGSVEVGRATLVAGMHVPFYATPTVTATSSPTDPTAAGAPFPLAPIVAPVVAIIILLLLAAVLVIVLVLGCKYGRSECSV